MEEIHITSSLYDYSVRFTDDLSYNLGLFKDSTAFIIDRNVYNLYRQLFAAVNQEHTFLMDAAEENKTMDTVMKLIHFWQQIGVKKDWRVVCFGGGISQDIATTASNLYLRNLDWHFFPTTLLSMCDSCIGGKSGINFGEYKNQLGVFYPPRTITIDISFLNTLSENDWLNGWGEILKFALTDGVSLYGALKAEEQYIPCKRIAEYICKGLQVKKKIIEEDEFESDRRRLLNYGHTFGHALEAYTHNEIPHGKAVIWGIDVVNYIAFREELISEAFYLDVKLLIKREFLKEEIRIAEPDLLFDIISSDKKVRGNTINFAIPNAPCHLMVYPMKLDQHLKNRFLQYLEHTHEYYSN